LLLQILGPQSGAVTATVLVSALEGDTNREQIVMLRDVAEGKATVNGFLERFGHRAVDEAEFAEPRWREDPVGVQRMLAQLEAGNHPRLCETLNHAKAQRRAAEASLPDQLAHRGGSCLLEKINSLLETARRLLPYRETGKHYLMMGCELIRATIVELGKRYGLGGDVFYLHRNELSPDRRAVHGLSQEIEARKERRQLWQQLAMPPVIDSQQLEDLGLTASRYHQRQIAGTTVAPGIGSGTAVVVLDKCKLASLPGDCVLVCPSTDPGWTPLFAHARAIVMERGGILSHGAIVARDFGIPAVVVPDATRLVTSGDRLQVDGNGGYIRFTESLM
jgi:pyruvate,water dikinase